MFLNEARIAAGLDHPNIVHVMDFGSEDGEPFMAMEYIHGRSVGDILRAAARRGPIPLECALTIVQGVAAALQYAHDRTGTDGRPLGLVHRDVSPTNVLVTFDGGVKLVDFGIAKATNSTRATRSGSLKGKLAYMAPEHARGEAIDRRADVFALGVVAYELTTGTRCFFAGGEFALLNRVAAAKFDKPTAVHADYPPDLEEIVLKALARDRDGRFATARDFQVAVERYAAAEGFSLSAVVLSDYMERVVRPDRLPDHRPAAAARSGAAHRVDPGGAAGSHRLDPAQAEVSPEPWTGRRGPGRRRCDRSRSTGGGGPGVLGRGRSGEADRWRSRPGGVASAGGRGWAPVRGLEDRAAPTGRVGACSHARPVLPMRRGRWPCVNRRSRWCKRTPTPVGRPGRPHRRPKTTRRNRGPADPSARPSAPRRRKTTVGCGGGRPHSGSPRAVITRLLLAVVLLGPAAGESASALERAEAAAMDGRFDDAAAAFGEAYAESGEPSALFGQAQSLKRAGRCAGCDRGIRAVSLAVAAQSRRGCGSVGDRRMQPATRTGPAPRGEPGRARANPGRARGAIDTPVAQAPLAGGLTATLVQGPTGRSAAGGRRRRRRRRGGPVRGGVRRGAQQPQPRVGARLRRPRPASEQSGRGGHHPARGGGRGNGGSGRAVRRGEPARSFGAGGPSAGPGPRPQLSARNASIRASTGPVKSAM